MLRQWLTFPVLSPDSHGVGGLLLLPLEGGGLALGSVGSGSRGAEGGQLLVSVGEGVLGGPVHPAVGDGWIDVVTRSWPEISPEDYSTE